MINKLKATVFQTGVDDNKEMLTFIEVSGIRLVYDALLNEIVSDSDQV